MFERVNVNNTRRKCEFAISSLHIPNIREMHIAFTFQKDWKYTKAVNKKWSFKIHNCVTIFDHLLEFQTFVYYRWLLWIESG